jgi:outer membrane cobalamin receptor
MNQQYHKLILFSTKLSLLIILFFVTLPAWGQTDSTAKHKHTFSVKDVLQIKPETAEPQVFTASRLSQKLSEAPATIYVITDKDIVTRGYTSLSDVLRDLVEFKFDEFGITDYYNSVTVRGIRTQDKFIILLDGVRISSPTNEPLSIVENFPVRLMKQIEIVTGPASALYGADALTGVINLISYKPDELGNARVSLSAGNHNYYNTSVAIGRKIKNINIRLAGQYTYDGQPNLAHFYPEHFRGIENLKTGRFNSIFGPFENVAPLQPEYDQRMHSYNWEVYAQYQDVSLSVHRNLSQTPSALGYYPDNAVYNGDNFLRQSVTKANLTYRKNLNKLTNLTTLYYSFYETDPHSSYRNVYSGFKNGYKYAYGSLFQLDQKVGYVFNPKFSLVSGLNLQSFFAIPKGDDLDRVINPSQVIDAKILNTPFDATFYKVRYFNFGTYAQLTYKPNAKVILTTGARYDYNTRFGGMFNPRLGFSFLPNKRTQIKAFYGEGFFAPSPYNVYRHFGSFYTLDSGRTWKSAYWFLPNYDLRPTTLRNIDVSLSQKAGSFSFQLLGYYMWVNDIVFQAPDATTGNRYNGMYKGWPVDFIQVFVNAGKQRNYGLNFTASMNHKWGNGKREKIWKPTVSIGLMDGVENNNGKETQIANIATVQVRLISDLIWNKWSLSVRWIGMNAQRVEAIDPEKNQRKTLPGYGVVNASLGFQANQYWRFNLTVFNALDQRYVNINDLAFRAPEVYNGSPQNPVRILLGIHINL